MSLLAELGICFGRWLQICRTYGAEPIANSWEYTSGTRLIETAIQLKRCSPYVRAHP